MSIVIAIPKEIQAGEKRVALTPSLIPSFTKLGMVLKLQTDAGKGINATNEKYKNIEIISDLPNLYHNCDFILKVQPPTLDEINEMREKTVLISLLYPMLNLKIIKALQEKNITSFAMDLIPRVSRAQNMDALSSQATIVGYKSVLLAADQSKFFFPMLTTAAGTIRPAKVFVIGCGVAGLQAIATAKRLGAQVSAYDIRYETKEQAESLGAKFLDTGINATSEGGYARELTSDEKFHATNSINKHLSNCDVVITTAGIPGKPAPKILTAAMVSLMQSGSIIIDTLAEMGGNCELTKLGETILTPNGVTISGPLNITSLLANPASEMYARNIFNFFSLLIKDGKFHPDWLDEIVATSLVTHENNIQNNTVKKLLEK